MVDWGSALIHPWGTLLNASRFWNSHSSPQTHKKPPPLRRRHLKPLAFSIGELIVPRQGAPCPSSVKAIRFKKLVSHKPQAWMEGVPGMRSNQRLSLLPMEITIDFDTPDVDLTKFVERHVPPLGVLKIVVQDGITKEDSLLGRVFGGVPITSTEEEVLVDHRVLPGRALSGVQAR